MAETYLKCPNCGAGNPEGKMFCGDCGTGLPQPPPPPPVQPTQPMYAQPKQSWIGSNWKGLVSVVVVAIVVLSVVGLIYTQPLSKIKVIVNSEYRLKIGVNVFIDNELKGALDLSQGTTTVGVWSVSAGSHVVALDHGTWTIYYTDSTGKVWFYADSYKAPDGTMDYAYQYSVGPLYTKNVFISITLPPH